MIYEFIQSNFVAVAITFFLILFILTNNNFEKRISRLFLAAATCVFILIIVEAWEAQLALGATYEPLRVPLSAIGYSLRPMIPFFLVLIAKKHNRLETIFLVVPLIINAVVAFSAFFCGIAYGYTKDNEFVRGPLGILPFFVAGFYVVVMLWLTLRDCRNGGMMETMIVSAIVLLAFTSTILESLFRFQFIQNPSIATSITFYYLFLHSNRNNRDPLTGALTRRRFYFDGEKYRSTLSAVISLDLNNLKLLNDQYGHTEGDKALAVVTNTIRKHMSMHASLYRTGGDEFMILCYKLKEPEVEELISKIREDLEKTPYRCAIGYALCPHKSDFEQVCQRADSMMYENKRLMKQNK